MESTMIQVLHLLSESSIDEPSTVTAKQWTRAIDYLVGCTGWTNFAWGYHLESPVHITLITGFKTSTDVQTFLSTNYPTFLGFLQPILASPPDPPAVTGHFPVMDSGKVTTISKLTFVSHKGDGGGILWRFKLYTNQLQKAAMYETGSAYIGVKRAAKWAVIDKETAEEKGKTLWVLAHYYNLEIEAKLEEKCFPEGVHQGENIKEHCLGFLQPYLQKEGAGEVVWHVKWNDETRSIGRETKNLAETIHS